ncbi:hypothetical protein [Glutamicibacter sp. NPDC087344]|uniref:hypothetical protein n=1 Tax=Glutamicibacter sp. NPDC087344 TaxID=3363994 RepID=UPI0037F9C2FB
MPANGEPPQQQDEVVFIDESVVWLIRNVVAAQRENAAEASVSLFAALQGQHPFSHQNKMNLLGFNTVEATQRDFHTIYGVSAQKVVGLIQSGKPSKVAVASGALDEDFVKILSKDEIVEALSAAWVNGKMNHEAAIATALGRIATSAQPDRIFASRREPGCGEVMPKLKTPCIRVRGHAGAHRGRR